MVAQSQAQFLFVGLSCPKQERWIGENKHRLPVPVSFAFGAAFDFIAGATKRAPFIFRKFGLEWFYRLVTEPRRLWKRYLFGNVTFLWMLMGELWRVRILGSKLSITPHQTN
jgi:N-acetylglucosaminyldiphosphoundecaprenol N-acetyl-beta-D-mannosaminyltransferase